MNSKTKLAAVVIIVVLLALTVIILFNSGNSNSSDDSKTVSATVWLDDGLSETSYEGSGGSVRDLVSDALSSHDIVFGGNGNVLSVDGKANTDDTVWTVFRWSSPTGWSVFTEGSSFTDDMTMAVSYADRTTTEGTVSYASPDIDVEYKVYFFVQMKEQYNSTEWIRNLSMDDATKQKGVWIEGTGSTSNEALADAVINYLYPGSDHDVIIGNDSISYTINGDVFFSYGVKPGQYGWFLSFLGWSDTKQNDEGGDYGTWTYWSQYTYHPDASSMDDPDQWGYDQKSFGLYDITEYRYFALVLQTTAAEDDVYSDIPTPSEIPSGL